MAHTYAEFKDRLENGTSIQIPVDELLRIMLSGIFPDGTSFEGVRVLDAGPSHDISMGVSGVRVTSANASAAPIAVTDAPTSGQKLVIVDALVSVDSALTVNFAEETTGTVLATLYMAANSTQMISARAARKLETADKKVTVQTNGAGNIAVTTWYYSEA